MIPREEAKLNAAKAERDERAAEVLGLSLGKISKQAEDLAAMLKKHQRNSYKIVLTGGAGSGKTTLANELSKKLEIPIYDLDNYIRGGWTPDREEYEQRLFHAIYDLWTDLPAGDYGWIVEHVEACSPTITKFLRPNFAVLLDPGEEALMAAARARNSVGSHDERREDRAVSSSKLAKEQFNAMNARSGERLGNIHIKVLEG